MGVPLYLTVHRGLSPTVAGAVVTLLGLGATCSQPATGAVVADVVSPEDRPRAYGLLHWAINMGFSLASVLGGVLAREGYAWPFVADAATCLGFAFTVWRRLPPDTPAVRVEKAGPGYRAVLRDRVMVCYLLLLVHATVHLQFLSTLPLDMSRHGLGPADFGAAIAVNGVLVSVCQPFAFRCLHRFDRSRVLEGGVALLGLGHALTAGAHSPAGYALTVGSGPSARSSSRSSRRPSSPTSPPMSSGPVQRGVRRRLRAGRGGGPDRRYLAADPRRVRRPLAHLRRGLRGGRLRPTAAGPRGARPAAERAARAASAGWVRVLIRSRRAVRRAGRRRPPTGRPGRSSPRRVRAG